MTHDTRNGCEARRAICCLDQLDCCFWPVSCARASLCQRRLPTDPEPPFGLRPPKRPRPKYSRRSPHRVDWRWALILVIPCDVNKVCLIEASVGLCTLHPYPRSARALSLFLSAWRFAPSTCGEQVIFTGWLGAPVHRCDSRTEKSPHGANRAGIGIDPARFRAGSPLYRSVNNVSHYAQGTLLWVKWNGLPATAKAPPNSNRSFPD